MAPPALGIAQDLVRGVEPLHVAHAASVRDVGVVAPRQSPKRVSNCRRVGLWRDLEQRVQVLFVGHPRSLLSLRLIGGPNDAPPLLSASMPHHPSPPYTHPPSVRLP